MILYLFKFFSSRNIFYLPWAYYHLSQTLFYYQKTANMWSRDHHDPLAPKYGIVIKKYFMISITLQEQNIYKKNISRHKIKWMKRNIFSRMICYAFGEKWKVTTWKDKYFILFDGGEGGIFNENIQPSVNGVKRNISIN